LRLLAISEIRAYPFERKQIEMNSPHRALGFVKNRTYYGKMTHMPLSVSELCSIFFYTISDEDDFYMQLVALDKVYSFLV
jgi:hypothetical protein